MGLGRHWEITLAHTERVKWYAPHIRHVVLDIHCSATSAPADPTAARAPPARQIPGESCNRKPLHPLHISAQFTCLQTFHLPGT